MSSLSQNQIILSKTVKSHFNELSSLKKITPVYLLQHNDDGSLSNLLLDQSIFDKNFVEQPTVDESMIQKPHPEEESIQQILTGQTKYTEEVQTSKE